MIDIKKLMKQVIAEVHGKGNMEAGAKGLASKYGLKNSDFLADILSVIAGLSAFHVDVVRESHAERSKLNAIRRNVENLRKAASAIFAAEDRTYVAGSLISILDGEDAFRALELVELLYPLQSVQTQVPAEPSAATLRAFVRPLCEYWWDCTDEVPTGRFRSAVEGFGPVPGTPAAFIVDALNIAGWAYSNERVAAAFGSLQQELLGLMDTGGRPN
jgi:hypothetical protein